MFKQKDLSIFTKFKEYAEWTLLAEQHFDLDQKGGYFQEKRCLNVSLKTLKEN